MSGEVALLRVFEIRAWARAVLLQAWVYPTWEVAFAPLLADAVSNGLVAEYGAAPLHAIVERACTDIGVALEPEDAGG